MKAFEQYFHVVLFIMLYKVIPTFNSVDETLQCDHSNEAIEQYVHMVQGGSNIFGLRIKSLQLYVWPFHVFIALNRSAKIEPVINQKPKTVQLW